MPALKNQRHERFVQALAMGMSQVDAYEEAGYRRNRGAACRLAENVSICERLAEIRQRVAIRTEVTVSEITDRLLSISKKAEALGEAAGLQAARASLMDVAKLNGLVVDKKDLTSSDGSLTPKPNIIEFVAPDAGED